MGMLAGCGGTSTSSSSTGEIVTAKLTVWGPSEDQAEDNNWLKTQCEAFAEENKDKYDLTFEYGTCSEGDAGETVSKDAEAAADVYMFANDQIPTLTSANALSKLGGTNLETIQGLNSETTMATVTYEDAVYGVPFTGNTWFMYYDKSVYSEDDIKNLDTMLEKGKVGFPLENSWYIASFYVANGCTFFGEDGTDESAGIDFSGDKAVAVTNYLVDLNANSNFVNMGSETGADKIGKKVDAMFSGSWDAATVKEQLGDNMGVAALPTITIDGEEKQMKSFAGSKAIGVNPNCENQDVAVALAAYLGGESAQKAHFEARGIIPTIASVDVGDDAVSAAQVATMDGTSIVQPVYSAMGSYWDPAASMGSEIAKGTVTHDNASDKTESMNTAMNTSTVE